MQLAANGWRVTAVERDERRLARLSENLDRTALSATLVAADVLTWEPETPADAILLDAPCSATGIFARHPDVLHRIRARDIAQLSEVQARLLARVVPWLKPGGRLIYATCSLEPEEGEQIAQQAEKLGLRLIAADPKSLPQGVVPRAEGWVRIWPGQGRDGFFIAQFEGA
jgi:16S rRNA (cytosine967-C5)-methyltransferase